MEKAMYEVVIYKTNSRKTTAELRGIVLATDEDDAKTTFCEYLYNQGLKHFANGTDYNFVAHKIPSGIYALYQR